MPATLKHVRKLEGERVRMMFDDGREELAVLLCATRDMDGSEHLIYERIEAAAGADETMPAEPPRCVYANARSLMSIEPVALAKIA